tara:strand:+ start:225 stop:401 length:177 start_codon:yes stop_codon:yes gene_type:complete
MNITIDIEEEEIDNLMDYMNHRVGRTLNISDRQGSAVYAVLSKIVEASSIQIMQGDKQ